MRCGARQDGADAVRRSWPRGWRTASSPRCATSTRTSWRRRWRRVAPGADAAELVARYRRVRRAAPLPRRSRARVVRALARHPGRGRGRHQRPAGRREAALPARRDPVRRARARTTSCSPPIRASTTCRSRIRAAALRERLAAWEELRTRAGRHRSAGGRSRFAPDATRPAAGLPRRPDYYFFESRGYGGESGEAAAGAGAALVRGNVRRRRTPRRTSPWPAPAAPRGHRGEPGGGRKSRQAHRRTRSRSGCCERLARARRFDLRGPRRGRRGGRAGATAPSAGLASGRRGCGTAPSPASPSIISAQPPLRGLRFRRPARGRRLRRAAAVRLRRLPDAPHVPALAPHGAGRMAVIRAENPDPASLLAEVDRALR